MPRPTDGYRNAAGQQVPGTHDPISRFMDQTALKFWAHKMGKEGRSLFERSALDIGTCVHTMIELDIKGQPEKDILFYLEQTLKEPGHVASARSAFAAWREWSKLHDLRPIAQEIPLVSERYQFGGTPDLIAMVDGKRCLLDFKTSKDGSVYPDKLLALAAHGRLWTEHNPGQLLTGGYHLIMLPKDGSKPRPHTYNDLEPQWELFKLYLQAYRLDKQCSDKKVLAGVPFVASPPIQPEATRETAVDAPPRKRATRKPRVQAPAAPTITIETPPPRATSVPIIKPTPSIGEILRSYGHIQEHA